MKRKILVSNQRTKECIDILKSFGIEEANATKQNCDSIDKIWNDIENDFKSKNGNPIWKDQSLILIETELKNETFILVNYNMVSYDDLKKVIDVDHYHFNGYL
jgi:hypothetical protein